MENEFNTEQKSGGSKSQTIIIVLLIIVIMGLVGLMSYDKFIAKKESEKPASTTETKEETKLEEKIEILDINNTLVKNLYKPFSYHTWSANSEERFSKDIMASNDLTNKYKNRLAYALYYDTVGSDKVVDYMQEGTEFNPPKMFVKSSTIENYYNKIFGTTNQYKATESIDTCNINGLSMIYVKEVDMYLYQGTCDASFFGYHESLNKAVKKDSSIELYTKVLVYNWDIDKGIMGAYSNIADASASSNAIKQLKVSTPDRQKMLDFISSLNQYENNAPEYKYTFTKDSTGNYYFTKIEKVNK